MQPAHPQCGPAATPKGQRLQRTDRCRASAPRLPHTRIPRTTSGRRTSDPPQQPIKRNTPVNRHNLHETVVVSNAVTKYWRPIRQKQDESSKLPLELVQLAICAQIRRQHVPQFGAHVGKRRIKLRRHCTTATPRTTGQHCLDTIPSAVPKLNIQVVRHKIMEKLPHHDNNEPPAPNLQRHKTQGPESFPVVHMTQTGDLRRKCPLHSLNYTKILNTLRMPQR